MQKETLTGSLRKVLESIDPDELFSSRDLSELTNPTVRPNQVSGLLCRVLAKDYNIFRLEMHGLNPDPRTYMFWMKINSGRDPKISLKPMGDSNGLDKSTFENAWFDLSKSVERKGYIGVEDIDSDILDGDRVVIFQRYADNSGLPVGNYQGKRVIVYHPKLAIERFKARSRFCRT